MNTTIVTFVANPFAATAGAGAWECLSCGEHLDLYLPGHDGLVAASQGLVAHAARCDRRRCN